jgi:hypothetical protein
MSDYSFVYDPPTPEYLEFLRKKKELEDFRWAIQYEDMIILKEYIKKHKSKFTNRWSNI